MAFPRGARERSGGGKGWQGRCSRLAPQLLPTPPDSRGADAASVEYQLPVAVAHLRNGSECTEWGGHICTPAKCPCETGGCCRVLGRGEVGSRGLLHPVPWEQRWWQLGKRWEEERSARSLTLWLGWSSYKALPPSLFFFLISRGQGAQDDGGDQQWDRADHGCPRPTRSLVLLGGSLVLGVMLLARG